MRSGCSIPPSPRRVVPVALAALWLVACRAPPTDDIAGQYRQEGPIAATLEVRQEAGQYVVRLEGGGSSATGAATPADCVIEARGELDGAILRARFGPVETDTFSYGADQAAREGRTVEIAFAPGAAEVVDAATLGYCGWSAAFSGRYRAVGQRPAAAAPKPPSRAAWGALRSPPREMWARAVPFRAAPQNRRVTARRPS